MTALAPTARTAPPAVSPRAVVVERAPFGDYFEEFTYGLLAAGRSERTVEAYRYGVTSLRDSVGSDDPADVTALGVTRWLHERRERVSPANADFCFRSARPFFRWLARLGYGEDPFTKVAAPKVATKVVEVLSDDEVRAMLAACAGSGLARQAGQVPHPGHARHRHAPR